MLEKPYGLGLPIDYDRFAERYNNIISYRDLREIGKFDDIFKTPGDAMSFSVYVLLRIIHESEFPTDCEEMKEAEDELTDYVRTLTNYDFGLERVPPRKYVNKSFVIKCTDSGTIYAVEWVPREGFRLLAYSKIAE